ncbi:MICAL-like protein 2a isoform X2 [Cynoglossus semilaevis]|uniref:MICAL-like protein 2a isoform X2 n=1 Tax=Cynoglossus semilaevis TaxID=244447 RepID=UPI000D62521E|nr:MICAL-like protein 2 isoform X2 [Cynoglossus semilaevis]
MAAIKALEQWCKTQCDGYRDVAITNMTTSFRNGMAFCALIHKYRPDLIDYESLKKDDVFENNRLAFQIAEERLGIPALLDAEDMVALRIPDRLSILTYVSQYYNYFNGRPPMGGVKRPAEGSREEPSEKKNLPVVAKTFVPKISAENRVNSTVSASASATATRAPDQKAVLAESANKNGTLNSKCIACKSHVHLVQRHFVEGRLYHRSCFKCSECLSVLHAGGYKPGKSADTFVCKKSCKTSPSKAAAENRLTGSVLQSSGVVQTQPAPRPTAVPPAAPTVAPKPPGLTPPPQSWTSSAQKTQVARQRFFQAAPSTSEASAERTRPADPSGHKHVRPSAVDEKSSGRAMTGKTLANRNNNNNNNNTYRFTVRSAERRFGNEPSPTEWSGKDKYSQEAAGSFAGRVSTSQSNNEKSPHLEEIGDDNRRSRSVQSEVKDPVGGGSQSSLKPMSPELCIKDDEVETSTERQEPQLMSSPSSDVSNATIQLPVFQLTTQPPSVAFNAVNLMDIPAEKPQPTSGVSGFKPACHTPVKVPTRRSAVESFEISATAAANHGNVSRAKKGKYVSAASTSRANRRTPSVTSHHVTMQQIEKQLCDIETNLVHLEKQGVELEKKLRSCEEGGEGDVLMDPLMIDWFNLIRKKQMFIRKESELVYIARTQELEQQQPSVEEELRRLLEKPDDLKSAEEQQQETLLMERLMEIVNGRNAIVEGLDKDRLREVEEDQQLNEMMRNLGVKKSKSKRKSSISKLFRRRSKRRVE